MTRKPSGFHLLDMLAEVPNPRKEKGLRHPLKAMLGLTVIGLMSGQNSYTAIATWGRTQPQLAKALEFRHPKTPCAATFHNLYKKLDVVRLEQTLTKWVQAKFESIPGLSTSRLTAVVSMDGKSLRGSSAEETYRTHLLAVVSHELGIPLAQCAVSEKTTEGFPISRQLLKAFDVGEKVVTTDALLTQRRFCQGVLAADADYALPMKVSNHKQMYQDIKDLFEPLSMTDTPEVETRRFECLHIEGGAYLQTHTDVQDARGVLTTRTLTASTLLTDYINWPGLAQVYQYRVEQKQTRTGKITQQTQYGITSLSPEVASAKDLLTLQVRTAGIPHVMAALRNTALSVLRFAGYTKIAETLRLFTTRPKLAVKLII